MKARTRARKNVGGWSAKGPLERLAEARRLLIDTESVESLAVLLDMLEEASETLSDLSSRFFASLPGHVSNEVSIARSGGDFYQGYFQLARDHSVGVAWSISQHEGKDRQVQWRGVIHPIWNGAIWNETRRGASPPTVPSNMAAVLAGPELQQQINTLNAEQDDLAVPPDSPYLSEYGPQFLLTVWRCVVVIKQLQIEHHGGDADGYIDVPIIDVMTVLRESVRSWRVITNRRLMDPPDSIVWNDPRRPRENPATTRGDMPNLKDNPAWVTHSIADAFASLSSQVPPQWMPKLDDVRGGPRGTLVAQLKEYGCGSYGCVLPTLDPEIVLKVTTDETEAQFASQLAHELVAPICVEYHMAVSLAARHEGRPIYLLWREGADDVGEVDKVIGVEAGYYIDEQHKAAQAAYLALRRRQDSAALLTAWEEACHELAVSVPELEPLAMGLIEVYRRQRIFMGDIHTGNIGRVFRGDDTGVWVITDPGHVAVLG